MKKRSNKGNKPNKANTENRANSENKANYGNQGYHGNNINNRVIHFIAYDKESILALISSLILSMIFMFNSPLHPWKGGASATDSSVFKTVAFMMEKGYMPYRDTFDHKGPVIYLLNYLGNKISDYRGIWVIEAFFLIVLIFAMYKIARLSCSIISSAITVLLALSILFTYFEGGNLTEEYAMPCIAIALFIFMDYLLNDKISNLRIMSAGIGCGIVLMLRPNMIAVWAVFCLFIFVDLLKERNYKQLIYSKNKINGILTKYVK